MTNIISQGHTSNILVRSKFRFKLLTHEGHLCGKVITSGTDCGIVCTRDEIKKNVENAIFFTEICRPYFCRIAFSLSRVVERKDSASFFFFDEFLSQNHLPQLIPSDGKDYVLLFSVTLLRLKRRDKIRPDFVGCTVLSGYKHNW